MFDPDGRGPVRSNGWPGDPKNFTVAIGIHTRGSALVTGSINFGIMIDNQGTFATYRENTLGGGLTLGASSAVNVGVHDGDVMAQKGKGWNMGFDAVVFGGELNMRDIDGYPGHEFLDVFKGGNIDTPAGFGLSAGIYFERSDVDFLSGGSLDYFFENSDMIFDELGVPEDKRSEFMQHIQQVNNAINENNCQEECIED